MSRREVLECDLCKGSRGDNGPLLEKELGSLDIQGASSLKDPKRKDHTSLKELCPNCTRRIYEFIQALATKRRDS